MFIQSFIKKEGENVPESFVLPTSFLEGDVDFAIHSYFKFNLKDFLPFLPDAEVSITTSHVSLVFVLFTILVFAIFANKAIRKADPYKAPGKFLNIVELIVKLLDNMTIGQMGKTYGPSYASYVGSLFMFLVVANLSGLLGLRPPTADYGCTFGLACITFVLIHSAGFKHQKFGHITGLFKPIILSPINIIGEIATPISMSLRLFGNILSGTVLMGLIYGLIPKLLTLFWPGFLHIYFDIFSGAIQAYVFTMLTMVFTSSNFAEE